MTPRSSALWCVLAAIELSALACLRPYTDTDSSSRFDASAWDLPSDELWGFVEIPEGSFRMGRSERDEGAEDDESPAHDIQVPAFFMAKHEVTIGQYDACLQNGKCLQPDDYALHGGRDSPIRYVSWISAAVYTVWLEDQLLSAKHTPRRIADALSGRRDGREWHVTLPSEPEWERAARGSAARMYVWGDSIAGGAVNSVESGLKCPAAVGSFMADRTTDGIYDLAGNVMEWTRSGYQDYPYRADQRELPYVQTQYVVRGGAFLSPRQHLRASDRRGYDSSDRSSTVGFRVVISRDVKRLVPPPL